MPKGVGADDVGALGKQGDAVEQARDLVFGRRVQEDRQRKGGFGDEDVAGDRLERAAGRVGLSLVVAADHGPAAAPLHRDLCAAQHMSRRFEPDLNAVESDRRAVVERLLGFAGAALPHADVHEGDRLRAGEDGAVAGSGVIGVGVGDHCAGDRADRVDVEIARGAVETLGAHFEPGFGVGHCLDVRVAAGWNTLTLPSPERRGFLGGSRVSRASCRFAGSAGPGSSAFRRGFVLASARSCGSACDTSPDGPGRLAGSRPAPVGPRR